MATDPFLELLRASTSLSPEALTRAQAEAAESGRPVGLVLLEQGEIDESTYAETLARSLNVPYFDAARLEAADSALADWVTARQAASLSLVAIEVDDEHLVLACADPTHLDRIDVLLPDLDRPTKAGLTTRSAMAEILERYYGVEGTTLWVDPQALKGALAAARARSEGMTSQEEEAQGPDTDLHTLDANLDTRDTDLHDPDAVREAQDTEKSPRPHGISRHPDESPISEPVWHSEVPDDAPTVGLAVRPGDLVRPPRGPRKKDDERRANGDVTADTIDHFEAVVPEHTTDKIQITLAGVVPAGGFKVAPPMSERDRGLEVSTAIDRSVDQLKGAPATSELSPTFGMGPTEEQAPSPVKVVIPRPLDRPFGMGPTEEQAPSPVKVVIPRPLVRPDPQYAAPTPSQLGRRLPPPQTPPPPKPGVRFEDRYQMIDRLGVGGMAEVWRARVLGAQGFRRMVVIKKILPEFNNNPEFVEMFIDEAHIACRLSHPNIAQIYELAEEKGQLYMVMEYVDGPDLATIFERSAGPGPHLSPHVAAHVVEQICAGLEYAHRATDDRGKPLNIIHRDVTPHNILVSYDGHVKIIDFGIAKAAEKISVTKVGHMKGKPGYIAPEQAMGARLDHRLDVFAAGIILCELLTQERLFSDSTSTEDLRKLAAFDPRPVLRWKLRLPGPLRAAAIRALQTRPDDRFQSARDLGQALRSWLRKRRQDPRDELIRYLTQHLPPVTGWDGPSAM